MQRKSGPDGALPPGSITFSDMSWNRTGSWRYLKPKFVRKFSPCSESCPAGNDVEGFLFLAGEGRYEEALAKILQESPFPGVCGRVCCHPCESACNRRISDDAVSIQGIERFVSQFEPSRPPQPGEPREEKVAVVGSGPAGLSCAYHLRRLGYSVTVFEKEDVLGGMLCLGIPRYRLPRRVLNRDIDRILALGIGLETGRRVGKDMSWDELLAGRDAVFLAIGAHAHVGLKIEGESCQGIMPGTGFLKKVNLGLPAALGRRVAVIGGGNTAMDCARVALRLGSRPVVVYRRTREEMPAIEAEVQEALEEGIEFEWLTSPVRALVDDGRVAGLQCTRNRLADPDDSGRRRPEPVEASEFVLDADTVITAVGEAVDLAVLPHGLKVEKGVVWIDSWGRTSMERIWAGGDSGPDQRMVVHAIGAGKKAALSIHATLRGNDIEGIAEPLRIGSSGSFSMERYLQGEQGGAVPVREVVRPEQINLDYFEHVPRIVQPRRAPSDRVQGFEEVNGGYDKNDADLEAKRCFHCGTCDLCGNCWRFCPDLCIRSGDVPGMNLLDDFHCKGCGICAEECPRSAIVMEREL